MEAATSTLVLLPTGHAVSSKKPRYKLGDTATLSHTHSLTSMAPCADLTALWSSSPPEDVPRHKVCLGPTGQVALETAQDIVLGPHLSSMDTR